MLTGLVSLFSLLALPLIALGGAYLAVKAFRALVARVAIRPAPAPTPDSPFPLKFPKLVAAATNAHAAPAR